MRKLLIALLMTSMLLTLTVNSANSADYEPVNVYVNNNSFIHNELYLIDNVTYVSVEDFKKSAGYDDIYIDAEEGRNYIIVNGRYLYNDSPVMIIESKMCVPLRLLVKAFCGIINWDSNSNTATVTTNGEILESGDTYYNEDDIYWMSRIIYSESGAESLKGQIAVGNVILNRVESDEFPNNIYDVIFDDKYAVQFTPTALGTIYNEPSDESIIAAKICMEGYTVSDDIMYFIEESMATSLWIVYNRPYQFSIGCHDFYS